MERSFSKTALAAAVLALLAGPALAAGAGGDTATGSTAPVVKGEQSGQMQKSAAGQAERDQRGDSYSGQTPANANVGAGGSVMHGTTGVNGAGSGDTSQ